MTLFQFHYKHGVRVTVLLLIQIASALCIQNVNAEAEKYYFQKFVYNGKSYQFRLLRGYKFELLSDRLDGPRMLSFDSNNNLFIGSKSGSVYKLMPPYTEPVIFTEFENYPHSVTFVKDKIFVAQTDGLYRSDYKNQNSIDREHFNRIFEVPDNGGHNSRTIATGPDGSIYFSLGITGNCSNEYLSTSYNWSLRKGGIYKIENPEAKIKVSVYANGLRNPVGFDWHPISKTLYASNNGPDHLGFEQPPEYFSEITEKSFHGMPWYIFDGTQIKQDSCQSSKPPL